MSTRSVSVSGASPQALEEALQATSQSPAKKAGNFLSRIWKNLTTSKKPIEKPAILQTVDEGFVVVSNKTEKTTTLIVQSRPPQDGSPSSSSRSASAPALPDGWDGGDDEDIQTPEEESFHDLLVPPTPNDHNKDADTVPGDWVADYDEEDPTPPLPEGWECCDEDIPSPSSASSSSSKTSGESVLRTDDEPEELCLVSEKGDAVHLMRTHEANHMTFSVGDQDLTLHFASAVERISSHQRLSTTEVLFLLDSLSKESAEGIEVVPHLLLGTPLEKMKVRKLSEKTEARFIVFPTGLSGMENHVIGIIYDRETKRLEFIDRTGKSPGDRMHDTIVNSGETVRAVLMQIQETLEVREIVYTQTPQQADHYNCAPFLVDYVESRCVHGADPEAILSADVDPQAIRSACLERVAKEHVARYRRTSV